MRYLLEAPDPEMEAWKADAAARGVTFAEWLRGAARLQAGTAAPETAAQAPRGPQDLARGATPRFKREKKGER